MGRYSCEEEAHDAYEAEQFAAWGDEQAHLASGSAAAEADALAKQEEEMLPTVLSGYLLESHRKAGIELYEPDDHILILRCKGEVIATYASTGAFVEEIRKDATEWLRKSEVKEMKQPICERTFSPDADDCVNCRERPCREKKQSEVKHDDTR